jgi:putative endonuclease
VSRARGKHWEIVAERWLRQQKAHIIGRNYSCRFGEIDLIARDGGDIAFVEVKYRSRSGYGSGAEHVTRSKQRKIVSTARQYLQNHRYAPAQVFRFDVISISDSPEGTQIQWIKSAFEAV